MKNIVIKKISLINFKGLRNQEINFDKNTNIFGDNGTGKTTIFDAFTWLMFGKDSNDRKDFEIKTLDKNNVVIPQIEHEVSAVVLVDNEEVSIRRILKENWVKKRGSLEAEFSGNVTDYYWNEVPMQQKEFQTKVSQILDETVFKMITNPLAFNSLKWQDRRNALIQIAGEISDSELATGNLEYENLIAQLTNGKTLEDYRKQIAASIKKAKEDLKAIPTRVDEISRSKPEAFDFLKLSIDLENKQSDLGKVDEEISDSNKAFQSKLDGQKDQKIKANNLKAEIQSIEANSKREAKEKTKPDTSILDKLNLKLKETEDNLETANNGFTTLNSKVITLENQIAGVNSKMETKRQEWATENAKELNFDNASFCCPTCKRDFEASDIETKKSEMLSNFRTSKDAKLLEIKKQGTALGEEKENLEKEVEALKVRIENGKTHIASIQEEIKNIKTEIDVEKAKCIPVDEMQEDLIYESILSMNANYKAKKSELETLEKTIEEIPAVDNSELVEKRKSLVVEIDDIKTKLQNETQINSVNQRIEALQKEESTLAQQIANVEKTQFVIENFNKLKIDTLEQKINSKFKFVNFKMFETQINGGEVECCDCLIDGVPFSDANTASKINAGLDIINTLCEFYQVTAPIFIDNRESIVKLIDIESQIVNLIVWEGSILNTKNPKVNGVLIDSKTGLKLEKEFA
jgi:DNA repair protein SbcC/Rad50